MLSLSCQLKSSDNGAEYVFCMALLVPSLSGEIRGLCKLCVYGKVSAIGTIWYGVAGAPTIDYRLRKIKPPAHRTHRTHSADFQDTVSVLYNRVPTVSQTVQRPP
jgi:hypothetical protein